jgi:hypothetical protein
MAVKSATKSATQKLATKEKQETKTAAVEGLIAEIASEVETLTQPKAFALTKELVEKGGEDDFRLGGALTLIQTNGWVGEYDSFEDLCEQEFRLHYRKANYLIKIYKALTEKQIPWEVVKNIGWSKLRELADILTPKNAAGWAKKAEKMTVIQIIEDVRNKKKANNEADATESEGTGLTTMTFKVHPDQKKVIREALDKVKEDTKTEFDTVALTNMATGILGGSETAAQGESDAAGATSVIEGDKWDGENPKKMPKHVKEQIAQLTELMTAYGEHTVFAAFDKAFPDITITVGGEEEEVAA